MTQSPDSAVPCCVTGAQSLETVGSRDKLGRPGTDFLWTSCSLSLSFTSDEMDIICASCMHED